MGCSQQNISARASKNRVLRWWRWRNKRRGIGVMSKGENEAAAAMAKWHGRKYGESAAYRKAASWHGMKIMTASGGAHQRVSNKAESIESGMASAGGNHR